MTKYTLDDLQLDIGDLKELLSATGELFDDMDFGSGSTRNHKLDRVSALNRIAMDKAERMSELLDEHYHAIKGKRAVP